MRWDKEKSQELEVLDLKLMAMAVQVDMPEIRGPDDPDQDYHWRLPPSQSKHSSDARSQVSDPVGKLPVRNC